MYIDVMKLLLDLECLHYKLTASFLKTVESALEQTIVLPLAERKM